MPLAIMDNYSQWGKSPDREGREARLVTINRGYRYSGYVLSKRKGIFSIFFSILWQKK
jgi:hypothetical protein